MDERNWWQIEVAQRYARVFGISVDEALLRIMDRFRDKHPNVA